PQRPRRRPPARPALKRRKTSRRFAKTIRSCEKCGLALIGMWPTQSTMQIANTLHRKHWEIRRKTTELRSEGLLESKSAPRVRSIKPDPRDFDDVKGTIAVSMASPSLNSTQG